MFNAASFTVVKIMDTPEHLSMDKWFENVIHTHTHTHRAMLLSYKKKEILPFATTWMNLKDVMLKERNQTQKNKCSMVLLVSEIENSETQQAESSVTKS